jgi:ABC-type antimicrobial peptide transport system permease subunit
LKERQFAVMSQSTRISEIHQQDSSLQLLVLIVGAGVFLFGVVTVVTVLLDSTERKRGTIGILRVMGVPRTAVFYMVFLRAAVIGALSAGVTLGLGYLAGQLLGWEPSPEMNWVTWKPIIKVIIEPEDMILVVVGALTCCGLGSLIPAFRASRLDPFDAIVEGRFR